MRVVSLGLVSLLAVGCSSSRVAKDMALPVEDAAGIHDGANDVATEPPDLSMVSDMPGADMDDLSVVDLIDLTPPPDLTADATPTCSDNLKNSSETDIDCGGSCPNRCANTKHCSSGSDCSSAVCQSTDMGLICAAATCMDLTKNLNETDVDCGGSCAKCAATKHCLVAADCSSAVCVAIDMGSVCAAATCADLVKNGDESDVDCGGGCNKCVLGKGCGAGTDCASTFCYQQVCVDSCHDGQKDFNESDIDCGGASCVKCGERKLCTAGTDCQSGNCVLGLCTDPGLIGWWRFDEGAGMTASDSSGLGSSGTISGSSFSSGFSGSALSMSGAGAVVVSNTAPFNSLAAVTVETWVNLADYAAAPMLAGKVGCFNLSVSAAGALTSAYPAPSLASNVVATTAHWQHLAMTYDGNAERLFVDGQPAGSAVRAGPLGTSVSALELGRWNGNSQFLSGLIDDVRVRNYARGNGDILDDATSMSWYRFDEGSGAAAADSTGNGFVGTLHSATYAAGRTGGGTALSLSGTTQYMTVPAGGNDLVTDFTISIWFKLAAPVGVGTNQYLLDLEGDGAVADSTPALLLTNNGAAHIVQLWSFYQHMPLSYSLYNTVIPNPVGTWHHYAIVRNSSVFTAYYDGVVTSSTYNGSLNTPFPALNFSRAKRIGTYSAVATAPGTTQYYWNGLIDDLHIYTRALSGAEVSALAH